MEISIVYMVAGMSSRFGGKIKQFAKVGPEGETLIEYSVKQAIDAGFNNIIFIVGHMTKQPFKQMFGQSYQGIPVAYAEQVFDPKSRDRPWGTADALASAHELIKGPYVVASGDDLYGTESLKLLADHLKSEKSSVALGHQLGTVIPEEGEVNRGIYTIDDKNNVITINEYFKISKKNLAEKGLQPTDYANMSIFGLQKESIEQIYHIVQYAKREFMGDRTKEIILANIIGGFISDGMEMKLIPSKNQWIGITNPEDELTVRKFLQETK